MLVTLVVQRLVRLVLLVLALVLLMLVVLVVLLVVLVSVWCVGWSACSKSVSHFKLVDTPTSKHEEKTCSKRASRVVDNVKEHLQWVCHVQCPRSCRCGH